MNYQWEKTCPLCMEEMDFTDQQFKPCKCGYQICVWCWNHLVDEAGNDEALCPACRSTYDKEKIKAMTVEIDRHGEMNFKDKQKLPKRRSKANKANYNPDVDRVVNRNLAYIVGIPINLADEETLCKREFFGQYGEILKIHVQNFKVDSPYYNKSSALYVTYSKEEEAKQCIQLVDDFILCGSLLRASYGKARFCNLWLKNKPCRNQACSYLHYDVPQEDICTKYDVISVCTGKESQGNALSIQKRSGSFLPPPIEKPLVSSTSATSQYNSRIGEISGSSSRGAYSMSHNPTLSQTGSKNHVAGQIQQDHNTGKKYMQGTQSRTVASIKNSTIDKDKIIEEIRLNIDCLDLSDDCLPDSLISNVQGSIYTGDNTEEVNMTQRVGKFPTFPSIRSNNGCNILELPNNGSSSHALNACLNPLRLHKPASTNSKTIAPPPKTPPSFYSSQTYNSKLSKTSKLPAVNSSNSFFSVEPVDFVNILSRKEKEREAPLSTNANSSLYGSNLFDISALSRNTRDQYHHQNQYLHRNQYQIESNQRNIYLDQMMTNEMNYYNNVIGRGQIGQAGNYVNSEMSTAHRQFGGQDNSVYQAANVNRFNSYYKPW